MRAGWIVLGACSFAPHGAAPDAFEVGNPGSPPTPTQLQAAATDCADVSLSWSASSGATGYTVFRDGAVIASPTTTSYVDTGLAPSTTYRYAVDAVDDAGHSTPTAAASVTTPACSVSAIRYVQSDTQQNGGSSVQLALNGLHAGNLLVGWFLGYQAGALVSVSDSVNGSWTLGCPGQYDGGGNGYVALYYVANTLAGNATITVSGSGASFMQASAAEYAGVATTSPLDHCSFSYGTSNLGSVGPTPALASPGELVFAATVDGSPAVTMSAGTGFMLRANDNNDGCEDRVAASTAPQTATMTFVPKNSPPTPPDWNMVIATFRPAP